MVFLVFLYVPCRQAPRVPSFVDRASMEYFPLHIASGASLRHVKTPQGPISAPLYLVGTLVLLLTVRVAVIRVISSGPGQSAPLLPEITDGNVPGNLHRMEDKYGESAADLLPLCNFTIILKYNYLPVICLFLFFCLCYSTKL